MIILELFEDIILWIFYNLFASKKRKQKDNEFYSALDNYLERSNREIINFCNKFVTTN